MAWMYSIGVLMSNIGVTNGQIVKNCQWVSYMMLLVILCFVGMDFIGLAMAGLFGVDDRY